MEQKHPGGRPTKYQLKFNTQVYKLCLMGATDDGIADFFEVDVSTINNWKIDYPKFFESIKKGKERADAEVATKLYKRAMGYRYDEVTFEKIDNKENIEVTSNGDLKTDSYKKKIVTKEVASDVTAAIFWLKNRQKNKWRDKTEVDNTIKIAKDLEDETYS